MKYQNESVNERFPLSVRIHENHRILQTRSSASLGQWALWDPHGLQKAAKAQAGQTIKTLISDNGRPKLRRLRPRSGACPTLSRRRRPRRVATPTLALWPFRGGGRRRSHQEARAARARPRWEPRCWVFCPDFPRWGPRRFRHRGPRRLLFLRFGYQTTHLSPQPCPTQQGAKDRPSASSAALRTRCRSAQRPRSAPAPWPGVSAATRARWQLAKGPQEAGPASPGSALQARPAPEPSRRPACRGQSEARGVARTVGPPW